MNSRMGASGPVTSIKGTVTVDLPSAGAAAITPASIALADVLPGDIITIVPPAGGLSVAVAMLPGYCAVAGTAIIPVVNPTAGALDAASAVCDYEIRR